MEKYQNEVQACLAAIKNEIRLRKLTYKMLAERLGVSELTIKRQVNAKDISMSKLLALCDAAELNFSEAWDSVDIQVPTYAFFTEKQDEAFYRNPHLMSFFFEMYENGKSPVEIQNERNLSASSLHLYLRKLEDIELIQLSAAGKVSFNFKPPIGFTGDSKILRKEVSEMLKEFHMRLAKDDSLTGLLLGESFRLSEELKLKFFDDLFETVSRYAELSEKYFAQSDHEVFELIVCENSQPKRDQAAKIKNLTGFE